MTPLLEEKVLNPTMAKTAHANRNIAGLFFDELVDIFVNKGDLSREAAEKMMEDRMFGLRPKFANIAKLLANDCFALSLGTSLPVKRDEVMQALDDWEHTGSTIESSQCVVLNVTVCDRAQ